MKKHIYLLVLAVCMTVCYTFAQETSDVSFVKPYALTQKKFIVTVQPLQLFNRSLRHDIEIRLGDGPGWLQFGPALYYGKRYEDDENPRYYYEDNNYSFTDWRFNISLREPFSEMRGGGLDINYKRFVNPMRSFYFAGGLSYTHFKIDYWGYEWDDFTEDGLPYHAYMLDYRNQHINRLGFNAYFGHQIPYRRGAFVLDMFWGLAYRESYSDKEKPSFDRDMFSYGYTGIVFMTGVKIGFGLR
jgi:hypothetical protein